MDKDIKAFKELAFKGFANLVDNYDKVEFNLLRIHEVMLENEDFAALPIEKQYKQCITINTIVVDTLRQHLNENRPLSLPEPKAFPRSIDYGYKQPTVHKVKEEGLWYPPTGI